MIVQIKVSLAKGWVKWYGIYNSIDEAYYDIMVQYPEYIQCEIIE